MPFKDITPPSGDKILRSQTGVAVPEPSTRLAALLTLAAIGYSQRKGIGKLRNSDCGLRI